ncbi:MAG: succinate--CoA ligase subunit alpha, partial [Candidatus Korarchaeota archaeon]|nr:succinate--CoA ligase subunit alpha [Candidatus Korarchaeota archaeon]
GHAARSIPAMAKRGGVRVRGPGPWGVKTQRKAVRGGGGGSLELAKEAFVPGRVGVISRSGGQTTTTSWAISRAGFGITTAVHTGSEPLVGLTEAELLAMFEEDEETNAVVLFAEIGGVQEEEAAEFVSNGGFTKPLIAYVAGRMLPKGMRFSHASAMVVGDKGSAESKIGAFKEAGVKLAESPKHIIELLRDVL